MSTKIHIRWSPRFRRQEPCIMRPVFSSFLRLQLHQNGFLSNCRFPSAINSFTVVWYDPGIMSQTRRWPPPDRNRSCRIFGHSGQGLFGSPCFRRLRHHLKLNRRISQPWRIEVPTQSFPVSPPPMTMTRFPLAEINFSVGQNPNPAGSWWSLSKSLRQNRYPLASRPGTLMSLGLEAPQARTTLIKLLQNFLPLSWYLPTSVFGTNSTPSSRMIAELPVDDRTYPASCWGFRSEEDLLSRSPPFEYRYQDARCLFSMIGRCQAGGTASDHRQPACRCGLPGRHRLRHSRLCRPFR